MTHERNERLATLLLEADWSRAQAAAAYNRVALETLNGEIRANSKIGRSHVSMWVGGVRAVRDRARYLMPGAVPSFEA